jgi:peptide/nickel transport system permease protein
VAAAGVVLVFVVMAVVGPLVWRIDPFRIDASSFEAPSARHPMGTDDLGRDVLAGVLHGARVSLVVGGLSALLSLSIGCTIGALAGFFGGRVDTTLMRLTDLFQVIPRFFLALAAVALFQPSVVNVIIVLGCTGWTSPARLLRIQFLSVKEREFALAARAAGASPLRVAVSHLLPNSLAPIVVDGSFQIAGAILLEASLSFLGLGDPHQMSWGRLLLGAQQFLRQAWWLAAFPGACVFVLVLSVNLVGDALNDALGRQPGAWRATA